MKLIFIGTSCTIVYIMKFVSSVSSTYDKKIDHFNILYLIVPSTLLALVINEFFSFTEILWTFSIYLEAVAIIPQLVVVQSHARQQGGFVEQLTSDYVFTLGGYRALYLVNWIYRYLTEDDYRNWIVWIAGVVQTAIYCDFFYYYAIAKVKGTRMALPI